MLAQVKFEPQEPRTKNGKKYIDILVTFPDGDPANIYALEDTRDWDALMQLERGQIIEVETYQDNGRTFYRLTESELERVEAGREHIANLRGGGPSENAELLCELFEQVARDLASRDMPVEASAENVQKLAVTAYMRD